MTEPSAVQVARSYFDAWSGGDFDAAMAYVDPDIECLAPAGPLRGADAFRAFMEPFSRIVTSARIVAIYGDDEQAVTIYDTATRPVADAPGAECVRVTGGRIGWMRIVFDRLPFEEARRAAAGG